jgi:tetratricopeptide (TPR) repeat protein
LLLAGNPSNADYQSGLDAYQAGDYKKAMRDWQEAAAEQPTSVNPYILAETHYAIAMLYWQGQGIARDYHKAREWLVKAANSDHAGAQAKLGFLYTDGIAVPQDFDRAFEWFSKAAKQGDVDGQYNLGIFYLNGWGTEQDITMAAQYLAAASAQGDEAAEQALQQVLAQIDSNRESGSLPHKPYPVEIVETDHAREDAPVLLNETWILAQNPAHYTIQIIALSSRTKVESLATLNHHLSPLATYTVQLSSNPLYVLVQGDYENAEAARQAAASIPHELQDAENLLIRRFSGVHELIGE